MFPAYQKALEYCINESTTLTAIRKGKKMENAIPTDSVLRRHYEATHGQRHGQNNQNKSSQSGGGFMCWLKRVFGG